MSSIFIYSKSQGRYQTQTNPSVDHDVRASTVSSKALQEEEKTVMLMSVVNTLSHTYSVSAG